MNKDLSRKMMMIAIRVGLRSFQSCMAPVLSVLAANRIFCSTFFSIKLKRWKVRRWGDITRKVMCHGGSNDCSSGTITSSVSDSVISVWRLGHVRSAVLDVMCLIIEYISWKFWYPFATYNDFHKTKWYAMKS
jgi:hypothetical protein